MNLLGFEITRRKTIPPGLQIPDSRGGWWPLVREAFAGAWQQNVETPILEVLSHPTVFACITLIAGDFAKTRHELVREADDDVWVSVDNPAFSPVLRKPNHFQDSVQFRQSWMTSKLESGNTYVLKVRDQRGVVTDLYVLDPWRVRPLIAPDGSVFYEVQYDQLAGQNDSVILPAREIIHDRFNTLFHPLVGISPLFAAGIPAMLGLRILTNSARFFGNNSTPSGILTTPGIVTQEVATRLKTQWETNQTGVNIGRIAVLGDGMKFETISQPADKSQLNEQWLSAAEAIAVCFHVPFYLVGGPMPPYNNIQSLNVQYYTQCLQPLFKAYEDVMDEGLGLTPGLINGTQYGVQLCTDDLLLMDTLTMTQVSRERIQGGIAAPNEERALINRLPVKGGDTPYLQQQNYSLAALDRRDKAPPTPPTPPQLPAAPPQAALPAPTDATPNPDNLPPDQVQAQLDDMLRKELNLERAE